MGKIQNLINLYKKDLLIQFKSMRIDIIFKENMKKSKIIKESEKAQEDVVKCIYLLNDLIEGYVIPDYTYYELLILFHQTSQIHLSGIQTKFNVYIDRNVEKKEIRICGLPADVQQAQVRIMDMMNTNKNISKKISFANKNISAFFINNKKLQTLFRDKYSSCTLHIDLKDKNFLLYGKEKMVEDFEKEIKNFIGTEIAVLHDSLICFICSGQVTNNYKMILCKMDKCCF